MMDTNLPKHIVEKLERRWMSQLGKQTSTWQGERPGRASQRQIVNSCGRLIPVISKRTRLRGGDRRLRVA